MHYFDREDPLAFTDFWERTATLDWCEQNYVLCTYIAEFWNTISNLVFISLAFVGAYMVKRTSQDSRFLLAYGAYGAVGVGSWLFHMTLSYEAQLLDELPMIYVTCVLIWIIFETERKPRYGLVLPALLVATAFAITAAYLVNKNPTLHQVAYGLLTALLVFRAGYLCQHTPDPVARATLQGLLARAFSMYAFGFLLWNVDNQFCPQIRAARAALPESIAWVLQLHAWWHIFTGLGGYIYISHLQYGRQVLLGEEDAFKVSYFANLVPIVLPRHQLSVKLD